jgi:hypothetical protein
MGERGICASHFFVWPSTTTDTSGIGAASSTSLIQIWSRTSEPKLSRPAWPLKPEPERLARCEWPKASTYMACLIREEGFAPRGSLLDRIAEACLCVYDSPGRFRVDHFVTGRLAVSIHAPKPFRRPTQGPDMLQLESRS